MADVAKTVKVVSNSSCACGVSLCELTTHRTAPESLDVLNTTPNNTDVLELTLNLPFPVEEISLQELIESEIALSKELIESQFLPRISDYTDTVDELGSSYCRKTFLKRCVSIFVYRNLKYNNININEYHIDKAIEACTIQLDSTFNKLGILVIYRSPKGDFTNFLK